VPLCFPNGWLLLPRIAAQSALNDPLLVVLVPVRMLMDGWQPPVNGFGSAAIRIPAVRRIGSVGMRSGRALAICSRKLPYPMIRANVLPPNGIVSE